jgi:hypothetical protein
MPKPTNLAETPLDKLSVASQRFASRATRLSEIIDALDVTFCSMPGKTPLWLTSDRIEVGFARIEGEWGIWLVDEDCSFYGSPEALPERVKAVSVSRKAKAFQLVLDLIPALEAEQNRLSALIDAAMSGARSPVKEKEHSGMGGE